MRFNETYQKSRAYKMRVLHRDLGGAPIAEATRQKKDARKKEERKEGSKKSKAHPYTLRSLTPDSETGVYALSKFQNHLLPRGRSEGGDIMVQCIL